MKRAEELEKEFNAINKEIEKAENFIKLKKEEALVVKGRYHEAKENEPEVIPAKKEETKKETKK